MDMGLVNSHIAHWMLQLADSSIRNVSLGTPWTMDVCIIIIIKGPPFGLLWSI